MIYFINSDLKGKPFLKRVFLTHSVFIFFLIMKGFAKFGSSLQGFILNYFQWFGQLPFYHRDEKVGDEIQLRIEVSPLYWAKGYFKVIYVAVFFSVTIMSLLPECDNVVLANILAIIYWDEIFLPGVQPAILLTLC